MAHPLKNANQGRGVSQILPSVKCSTCHRPVPLADLGDHVCAHPPAVPALPTPVHSPHSAASLLPPRLQNLANAPLSPSRSPIPVPSSSRLSPKPHDRSVGHVPSPLSSSISSRHFTEDRARSPLSRSDIDRVPTPVRATPVQERMRTPSAPQRDFRPDRRDIDRHIYPQSSPSSSPLRSFAQSNPSQTSMAPSRPSNMRPPPQTVPPTPTFETQFDTKIGGEAGMAGVGRRGFAAAAHAHATMVSAAPPYNQPSQNVDINALSSVDPRRANAPRYLDMEASRTIATPPLSPNSTSSHSYSSGPISPHAQSIHNDRNKIASRSPSPSQYPYAETNIVSASRLPPPPPEIPKTPETPLSAALSARLPFFEKYKNKFPGNNPDPRSLQGGVPSPVSTPAPPAPSPRLSGPRRAVEPESRNATPRPEARGASEPKPIPNHKRNDTGNKLDPLMLSSSSGSETGLAYANSTDNSDDEKSRIQPLKARQKKAPPPPLNLPDVASQVRFPLLSPKGVEQQNSKLSDGLFDRNPRRRPSDGMTKPDPVVPKSPPALSKAENKSQQQQQYRATPGGNEGNDRTVSASTVLSAEGSSVYSKSTGTGTGLGGLNKTMETLLEDIANEAGPLSAALTPGSALTKSKSASALASPTNSMMGGSKAQRSHTVSSPDSKSHKLPARSATGSSHRTDSNPSRPSVEEKSYRGPSDRKPVVAERKKDEKRRACARCDVTLADKRWVQMDGGSVLCEKCWKNMYLPKCRRCNLPIEKQAVSSSDGQLKGKYHRECFDCDKCHKPFPDKTFYIFDGKPLCAYHYHEANDSLCAASSCGQPIEGPCALSHAGDRYHPEHFLCEYPGYPKCRERLAEYWEIDGRMLCERHASSTATRSDKGDNSEDEHRSWTPSAKATKRVTRFIDLAGSGLR